MSIPSITDLTRYINRKLTGINWNNNLQKIVNWFTDGTADVSFNTVDIIKGLDVGTNLTVGGNVTATNFFGDGSSITNINQWRKNYIINGGCILKNNADYTLVKDVYGESVDQFEGMATGTAVSAGTLSQTTSANCGTTGYALKFNEVTLTGTGIIYLRHRFYSKNAVNFKNKIVSFSCQVYQDTPSSVPYTIYLNKADTIDDFSSVTEITNSGGVGVDSSTDTQIKLENISVGDCSNGLEILIKVDCGEITLKSFQFTEIQLEIGSVVSEFEYLPINQDISMNNYDQNGNYIENLNFLNNKIITGTDIIDTEQIKNYSITESKLDYKSLALYECRKVPLLCQTIGLTYINNSNSLLATVDVGTSPLASTFDGSAIWVINSGSSNVTKINITTNAVITTVSVGANPESIAFDGSAIWVMCRGDSTLYKINITTNAVIATINLTTGFSFSLSSLCFDGSALWLGSEYNGIYKINITTNAVITTIAQNCYGLCFDGSFLWASASNVVIKINISTNSVILSLVANGTNISMTYDGDYVWVSDEVASTIYNWNSSVYYNAVLSSSVDVDVNVTGLCFDSKFIWASAISSDFVLKIDSRNKQVLNKITVGSAPRGITFDGNNIWVANKDSNSVSKISIYKE